MAAAINMRNALTRCGLNETAADYVMQVQGYDTPEELALAPQDDLDQMIKNAIKSAPEDVIFPATAIRKVNTFKFWAEEMLMCGLSASAVLLTPQVRDEYLRTLRADEIEVKAKKDQIPTKPDPLKQEKEWFKFWEKLKNYLGQIRGAAKVPISYVVCDHDEVTEAMHTETYGSHTAKVQALVLLSGEHFKVDNTSIWEIVKTLVIDGFGWNYVKRFDKTMDGRAAVMALRRQCEGKTSIKTRKNKAYLSIANSSYRGPRKAFTFAQYVAIHQAAHNELEDCNETMPETKKVSDFINGISDSELSAGITCIQSDDRYSDNFEATQQFLGTLVANQQVHKQGKRGASEDRKVAATNTGSARVEERARKRKLKPGFIQMRSGAS